MEMADLMNRFEYHPPSNETVKGNHEWMREQAFILAVHINDVCPEGREKALAITKLEEALFWANAAIARNQ